MKATPNPPKKRLKVFADGGQKLSGRSPTVRLKRWWIHKATEEQRDHWRERFTSTTTQAKLRQELREKLGLWLKGDSSLTQFRAWVQRQDDRETEQERAAEEADLIMRQHPDWTKEQVRDEVIRRGYFRTLADGDYKLGLAVVAADTRLEAMGLDREKLELLKRQAAKADETEKVVRDAELSDEARAQRIKEIYGRA